MTPDDVHTDEMPKPSDDLWPAGDPALAALAEDLRIVASGPAPEPRPGLVAVMGRGAATAVRPHAGRPKMLAKTVLGSLAAKVAMGVGMAAASVTAAGAAGVLPAPAQHAVASVVGATTPFALPDSATSRTPDGHDDGLKPPTSTTVAGAGDHTGQDAADDRAGNEVGGVAGGAAGDRAQNHGACVSAVAGDKSGTGSHGKTVSSVAHSDCGKEPTTSSTVAPTTSTTRPGTSTRSSTVAGQNRGANAGPGRAGDDKGGDDNGSSAGKGADGKGSSGKGDATKG